VLHGFHRWPVWMWANEEVVELVEWLRHYNDGLPEEEKVGFYGLDVYSLWDSMYQVLGYLRKNDPKLLAMAHKVFQCFEPYEENVEEYARATTWMSASCECEVIDLLRQIHKAPAHDGDGREGRFVAEQNALVVKNAESYYRAMVRGGPLSWNIRDRHMAETLERLMEHHGSEARCIVWEHNTHIGDARYTDMADDGMVNVGQLVRERHADTGVVLVVFGSHRGSVIAGRAWEVTPEQMPVPLARTGSWEDVLHQVSPSNKLLLFPPEGVDRLLLEERGHRAIGVVYQPEREHLGNYVPTVLPRRYDAFLYLDETEALRPLPQLEVDRDKVPETFPSGM
jgi:erythromycin esterase-like protein